MYFYDANMFDSLITKLKYLLISVKDERITESQLNHRDNDESNAILIICSIEQNCLFVKDRNSGTRFLIDSGATVSLLSRSDVSKLSISQGSLEAINGSKIATYGTITKNLNFGSTHEYYWDFTIADVELSIIGADFLTYYEMLIDFGNGRLLGSLNANNTLCKWIYSMEKRYNLWDCLRRFIVLVYRLIIISIGMSLIFNWYN